MSLKDFPTAAEAASSLRSGIGGMAYSARDSNAANRSNKQRSAMGRPSDVQDVDAGDSTWVDDEDEMDFTKTPIFEDAGEVISSITQEKTQEIRKVEKPTGPSDFERFFKNPLPSTRIAEIKRPTSVEVDKKNVETMTATTTPTSISQPPVTNILSKVKEHEIKSKISSEVTQTKTLLQEENRIIPKSEPLPINSPLSGISSDDSRNRGRSISSSPSNAYDRNREARHSQDERNRYLSDHPPQLLHRSEDEKSKKIEMEQKLISKKSAAIVENVKREDTAISPSRILPPEQGAKPKVSDISPSFKSQINRISPTRSDKKMPTTTTATTTSTTLTASSSITATVEKESKPEVGNHHFVDRDRVSKSLNPSDKNDMIMKRVDGLQRESSILTKELTLEKLQREYTTERKDVITNDRQSGINSLSRPRSTRGRSNYDERLKDRNYKEMKDTEYAQRLDSVMVKLKEKMGTTTPTDVIKPISKPTHSQGSDDRRTKFESRHESLRNMIKPVRAIDKYKGTQRPDIEQKSKTRGENQNWRIRDSSPQKKPEDTTQIFGNDNKIVSKSSSSMSESNVKLTEKTLVENDEVSKKELIIEDNNSLNTWTGTSSSPTSNISQLDESKKMTQADSNTSTTGFISLSNSQNNDKILQESKDFSMLKVSPLPPPDPKSNPWGNSPLSLPMTTSKPSDSNLSSTINKPDRNLPSPASEFTSMWRSTPQASPENSYKRVVDEDDDVKVAIRGFEDLDSNLDISLPHESTSIQRPYNLSSTSSAAAGGSNGQLQQTKDMSELSTDSNTRSSSGLVLTPLIPHGDANKMYRMSPHGWQNDNSNASHISKPKNSFGMIGNQEVKPLYSDNFGPVWASRNQMTQHSPSFSLAAPQIGTNSTLLPSFSHGSRAPDVFDVSTSKKFHHGNDQSIHSLPTRQPHGPPSGIPTTLESNLTPLTPLQVKMRSITPLDKSGNVGPSSVSNSNSGNNNDSNSNNTNNNNSISNINHTSGNKFSGLIPLGSPMQVSVESFQSQFRPADIINHNEISMDLQRPEGMEQRPFPVFGNAFHLQSVSLLLFHYH